jgi:small subunit ribosomal protein S6
MRQYELMVIVHPDVAEDGLANTVDTIRDWASAAGEIVKIDNWGRRKFAYPIRKLQEGNYILFNVQLEPAAVAELERNLRLSEEVLRHLLVRLDA